MTVRIAVIAVALLASIELTAQAPFDGGQGGPAGRTFIPERFYNTFSFAHPPAMRI